MSWYLVKNIAVNNNEAYELDLPLAFSEYGYVSKPYLRTDAFHRREVTFDFEQIDMINRHTTENHNDQPCIPDLIDYEYYHDYQRVQVLPMPKTSAVVFLNDSELVPIYDNDVNQAIFEQLLDHLQLDFLVLTI